MDKCISLYCLAWLMAFQPVVGCASEHVKGRVWLKEDSPSFVAFPEQRTEDIIYPGFENWKELKEQKNTVGVVFSGGGTRSAALTLGQLRALNELEWLDDIHYISAVSGGAWTAVPFTYFQREDIGEFLGTYIQPNQLSDTDLKSIKDRSFGKAITESGVIWDVLFAWFTLKGDESFAHVLGQNFLKPFGLHENKFFTSYSSDNNTGDVLNEILKENVNLKRNDFYSIKRKTPFLIVGGTLQKTHHGFTAVASKPQDIFPLEITPLYVGISSERAALGEDKKKIGGGYVEPLMYDSTPPEKAISGNMFLGGIAQASRSRFPVTLKSARNRFTLADVIAVSGSAPQAFFTGSLRYLLIPSNLGFPELRHWPITTNNEEYKPKRSEDYVHGDGGNIDSIGLLPLLSRQVDKIMVFLNTYTKFKGGFEEATDIPDRTMSSALKDYFVDISKAPKNVVFDKKKLFELYRAISKRKDTGQPLVHCDDYDVQRNRHHNIFKYKTHICWVYNDKPNRWVNLIKQNKKLKNERKKIVDEKNPYKNIPHTRTFFQQWHDLQTIDRKNQHVNAESNISAWVVCESAEELVEEIFSHVPTELKKTNCGKQQEVTTTLLGSP